ncbi:putative response regulatory protein [Paenibacillus konkukensis]|uniref:Response regulatory protein n=1 Tax=Paenibacillus konkukensis TaxID=2020716 RepID=A0ABY4RQB7_9BACL|nr:response regulator [Paenibacillus konkukensis]UQZ84654.1 putative response regulatory protein [Paenibacillus konkukensis]
MFSLYIADDERWVRQGLRSTIDWHSEGIEPIGEAEDGLEAFDFITAYTPDILVTDIKMPGMDGLELMANLKQRNIKTKVIFISGYTDFSYAKHAVKLGAYDYVVKPIEEDVLLDVVRRCTADLAQEREQNQRLERMAESMRECLPLARQRLLEMLLFNESQAPIDLLPKWETLGIKLDPSGIQVLAVAVQCWREKGTSEKSRSLVRIGLANIGEEIGGSWGSVLGCPLDHHEIDVILLLSRRTCSAPESQACSDPLFSGLLQFVEAAKRYLGVDVNVGTSRPRDVSNVSVSCHEALHALSCGFLEGSGRVYEAAKLPFIDEGGAPDYTGPGDVWMNRFINAIKLGDQEKMKEQLEELEHHLHSSVPSTKPLQLSRGLTSLVKQVTDKLDLTGAEDAAARETLARLKKEAAALRLQLPLIKELLLPFFIQASAQIGHKDSLKRNIQLAIEYICRHDLQDISMNEVAGHVHLNPSYFSKAFHDETGETFSKFIMRQKIARAKKLLKLTTMKVYEIAAQIGYTDLRHFVRIFKESEGITPSQYRDKG